MHQNAFIRLLLLLSSIGLFSCKNASPEKCFDVAVLNSNMVIGFANDGLWRELQSPPAKMGKTKDEVVPMKRREVVDQKIKFVEENLEKLQGLPQTSETKEIIQTSLALHRYILPVYKTQYRQLADDFDAGAPKEALEKKADDIHNKFFAGFESLYKQLIGSGKQYAAAHKIEVRWAM